VGAVARLAPLAAARARPITPALQRPLPRIPLRRVLIGAVALSVALALAYSLARETALFAVKDIEVIGARGEVELEVRRALAELDGVSLVEVDRSELEGRLDDLPSVADAAVDRSFPHAVRVLVIPERPLAVVRARGVALLVSVRGRVIRALELGSEGHLPRVWSPSAGKLAPGSPVDAKALVLLRALATVPGRFPVRIREARGDSENLAFTLAGGTELRLGTSDDLAAKLAAAQAVLSSLPRSERRDLAYLDVALPQRVVGSSESRLESEG
jgi:cell division septal protein FtsQ